MKTIRLRFFILLFFASFHLVDLDLFGHQLCFLCGPGRMFQVVFEGMDNLTHFIQLVVSRWSKLNNPPSILFQKLFELLRSRSFTPVSAVPQKIERSQVTLFTYNPEMAVS